MKIYKLAQTDAVTRKIKKVLQTIFSKVGEKFQSKPEWDPTYSFNVSVEKNDPSHPMGESWIQVWHSRDYVNPSDNSSLIHVERYFESELAQDEYGKTVKVPINFDNPEQSIAEVMQALENI